MNELDSIEAELRKLKPATPPEELIARLAAAKTVSGASDHHARIERATHRNFNWLWLRWLAPVTAAAAAVALLIWTALVTQPKPQVQTALASAKPALKANEVEIDQQLVADFDTVARLPSGEPVRFRCREWNDGVVLRDVSQGIVIEQSTPRLEMVPVSFETY